jgi:asparagine synthase (glutamine-hydrolysing)
VSAIFGIFHGDFSPISLTDMQRLRVRLSKRGPDDSGIWSEGGVALGNCLLRTNSVHERLPSADPFGQYVITADARLDNREELIQELSLTGAPADEIPDSAIILEAYRKWGKSCPAHLLGDFAFAIWDRKERTFFCARDQFGIKPLYYARVGRNFAFSSCIDGLLQLDWVPRRLNEQRLASHLTTYFGDTAATFYADISRLPPAHTLCASEEAVQVTNYWTLSPECETRFESQEEYVEAFRALFQQAVRRRLRTTCRIGAMLSGGLDSSSIAGVAGHFLGEEGRGSLATFSAVFDEVPQSNERRFIDAAVKFGGFEPSYLAADQCNPFLAPLELEDAQGEAHVAANMFLNWGLYGLARDRGVRVLLDGFDGDTTISHGITYLLELARAKRWLKFSQLVPAAARICDCPPRQLWWEYFWQYGLSPKLPHGVLRVGRGVARRWRRWRGKDTSGQTQSVLDPCFAKRIGLREYRASLKSTSGRAAWTEKEAHYQTIAWGVMPATLEMLQEAAAPFGIELRFPFWDRHLVEFCLGLPPGFKIRDGYTRWILRQAMEGMLPPEVQWRAGKSNIGHAFKHCLLKHGHEVMERAWATAGARLRPYVSANVSKLRAGSPRLLRVIKKRFYAGRWPTCLSG